MIYKPLDLDDVLLICAERIADARGCFMRLIDRKELSERGLVHDFVQQSLAYNALPGTLRGLHYQLAPFGETKLILCTKGSLFDVLVDVRRNSPTFGKWTSIVLDAGAHATLYVPSGFAHGYQTLQPDTEVLYHITPEHEPAAAAGINYADPSLAIPWPIPNPIVSDRDRGLPLLT